MAGCCWGAPTDAAVGVSLPEASVAYLRDPGLHAGAGTVPLHPVAAYEATGLFVLLAVLLAIRVRNGVEAPWRQASRYALGYGAVRACTEVFRGDASRGFVFELTAPGLAPSLGLPADHPIALSISQLVALGLVIVGIYGLRTTRSP